MWYLSDEDLRGALQSRSLQRVHRRSFLTLFASATIAGCAPLERVPSEPVNLTDRATVLGIPNARFYADTQAAEMVQEAVRALDRERAANPGSIGPGGRLPPAYYLGLSGGSDNGAFGAGLLVGWTDAGLMFAAGLVFARAATTWVRARKLIVEHKTQIRSGPLPG